MWDLESGAMQALVQDVGTVGCSYIAGDLGGTWADIWVTWHAKTGGLRLAWRQDWSRPVKTGQDWSRLVI